MAFLEWSKDERKKMREKFPELKNQEISSKLGEAWKALSDDVRKPFITKAAEARAARKLKAREDVAKAVSDDQKKHKHKSSKHKSKRDRSASPPPRPKKEEKKKDKKKKKKERRSDTESESDSTSGSESD